MIEAEVFDYLALDPTLQAAAGTMDGSKCMAGIAILTAAKTLQGQEVRSKLLAGFAELHHT